MKDKFRKNIEYMQFLFFLFSILKLEEKSICGGKIYLASVTKQKRKREFPDLSTPDIWGQRILPWGGGAVLCTVRCLVASALSAYPMPGTQPSPQNQKCPQMLPDSPRVGKSPLSENRWCKLKVRYSEKLEIRFTLPSVY